MLEQYHFLKCEEQFFSSNIINSPYRGLKVRYHTTKTYTFKIYCKLTARLIFSAFTSRKCIVTAVTVVSNWVCVECRRTDSSQCADSGTVHPQCSSETVLPLKFCKEWVRLADRITFQPSFRTQDFKYIFGSVLHNLIIQNVLLSCLSIAAVMRCGRTCRPLYHMKKLLCSQGCGKRDTCMLPVGCAASQYFFKLPDIDMVIVGKGMMSHVQSTACLLFCHVRYVCTYTDCHTEHTTVM